MIRESQWSSFEAEGAKSNNDTSSTASSQQATRQEQLELPQPSSEGIEGDFYRVSQGPARQPKKQKARSSKKQANRISSSTVPTACALVQQATPLESEIHDKMKLRKAQPRATSDAGQKQYVQISAAGHGRRPGSSPGAGCLRVLEMAEMCPGMATLGGGGIAFALHPQTPPALWLCWCGAGREQQSNGQLARVSSSQISNLTTPLHAAAARSIWTKIPCLRCSL
ncbi:hypothetical protein TgHK011_002855 [Trichoderma gracile]|nr:hypothetical protein TgHK011_002855 [Trichoderma gracile]